MINIVQTKVSHVLVRKGRPITVINRPRRVETRVVQSAAPLPLTDAVIPDPGDLTLIFNNQLL